jgi:hypothetical protein
VQVERKADHARRFDQRAVASAARVIFGAFVTGAARAGHPKSMRIATLLAGGFVLLLVSAPRCAAAEENTEAPQPPVSPAPAPSRAPYGAITLHASYGVVNSEHAQVFRALEVGAVRAFGKTYFGLMVGFGEGIDNSTEENFADSRPHEHYDHAYYDAWFGTQIGWGAPFRPTSRWGVVLKTAAIGGVRDTSLDEGGFGAHDPARFVSVLGEVSVRLALCKCQVLRPFVGASGRWVASHFGDSVQSAGIDLGLVLGP